MAIRGLATHLSHIRLANVVAPARISAAVADLGPLLVFSKFLVCPIMAFLIWQQDDRLSAILALLWPIVVLAIERSMNLIQKAVFRFKGRTLRDELENVERRFLQAIGYPAQKPGGNRQSIR
jgi:hypothetical protein